MNLKEHIRSIPDFPKKGILFKDITTLLENNDAFKYCTNKLVEYSKHYSFTKIAAIESRGFIFASILSHILSKPLILLRKKNKLPGRKFSVEYTLEYGSETIQMHKNSVCKNDRVLIIDDLIATGGSAKASADLIELSEGTIAGFLFVIELSDLNGTKLLIDCGYQTNSIVFY